MCQDNVSNLKHEIQALLIKNSDVLNRDIRKLNNAGEKFITESGVYKLIFFSRQATFITLWHKFILRKHKFKVGVDKFG